MSCTKKILFYSTFIFSLMCIALLTPQAHSNSVLSTPAISPAIKATNVKLQLFWYHQFEFAGFYAAIEQGYFKKYNIHVELLEFDPTFNITDIVLNEKAQFGLAGTEIIESYHRGKDVILMASYFKRSPLTIITQSEIISLKQLSNKKLYGINQHLKQGSIKEMLNLFDVDPTNINMTMKGNYLELFEKKEIAGILAYRTNIPYELNQKNLSYRMFDPNQFGIASQDLNLFTSGKFAEEHPELVKNFILAANEGWSYAIKHPNEIIDLIQAQYNIQKLTNDALKFEANETIKLISPELFEIGSIQKNKLITISEESFSSKSIENIKNIDNLIFQPNLKQAIDPELLKLLSGEEKKYLVDHPIIRVQNENDYPPFNYSINGKPTGYSIDYLKLISTKMAVNIQFIQNKTWQEYLGMLTSNKLDAMVNMMETEDRKEFYSFTPPFAEPNNVAVTRDSNAADVIDEDSIKTKRLVVVKGYAASDKYEKLYPSMVIIKVKGVLEALKAIKDKEADIFISNDAVINFYIEKHYITGLKLVSLAKELEYPNTSLSIATNINNPILKNILQKAMSTIAEYETLALRKRWLSEVKSTTKTIVNLSQAEKKYLANNPIIRVQNDGNYPPFNYLIDGNPSGYSIDLINLITNMLGIKSELIKGKTWTEYMTMLKNGELDILINVVDLDSRRDFAGFTDPYIEMSTFAVSRKNEFPSVISKENLQQKRIALTQGYAINEKLKRSLPNSIFVPVKETLEALKLISTNKADVYFEAGSVLDYYMTKNMMPNLQLVPVAADLNVINQKFSIATHKENKILLSILQKAVNAIPDIEQIRLKRKWFGNKSQADKDETYNPKELEFIKNESITLCRPSLDQGFDKAIPLIDLITRNLELNITMSRPMNWADRLRALEEKECDILLSATKTKDRQTKFNFTPNYFSAELTIITKEDQDTIYDISDHPTKHFAITKKHNSINLLKKSYPEIKLIEVNSSIDGVELVKQGRVLGYIYSFNLANSLLKNNKLTTLKINAQLREKFNDFEAIATRKEDKLLHSILTKALKNTDKNELNTLINQNREKTNLIEFAPNELALLKSRKVILCVANDSLNWSKALPYFLKSVDMKLTKSKNFIWNDALNALEKGVCDFLPEVTPTDARLKTMSFTPTIHQEGRVIVTTNEQNFINNIEDYSDKRFALLKGDILNNQLKESYPNIKTILVDNGLSGMQMVQKQQAFAYIGSISIISSVISKYGLKNLKIAGSLPDKFSNKWAIATRKDDVILNSIFSKIILSLDKRDIRKKLFEDIIVKYEQRFDYTLFWQMLFIALIILTVIIFWNRRLAALNFQLKLSKDITEEAQQKVASQNREIFETHQQLIQSEKMASLGTLTAGVAHEINNPTNFTYAAVYMMKDEIDKIKAYLIQLAGGENADAAVIKSFDEKFEKLTELAKTANEGTNRIKMIVEDLRTFARLGDAKQAQIQVSELITSTVNLIKTQFENITINTEFEYNPILTCFPSKLNQVFMNIIVNACQSIQIKIEKNKNLNPTYQLAGLITIKTTEHDNYLIINVIDNGCGMDKLIQQKVCEPFFTTKDVGIGTGLGMAISFGIIEEHDGMLKIASEPNEGSDFSIYLPVSMDSTENKKIRSK